MDHLIVVTCWNSFVLLDCDDKNDYPATLPLEELEYGEAVGRQRAVANRVAATPIGSMYGIFTYIYHKCRSIYHTWILWDMAAISATNSIRESPRKQQEFGPMQWSFAAPKFVACFVFFVFFGGSGGQNQQSAESKKKWSMLCYVYIFDIYNMIQWIYVQ